MPSQAGDRRNLGYRLVRWVVQRLLAVFYRGIDAVGLAHVPVDGPLIIVANHQNGLVDAMLLLATIPRRLVPIAKAPLFRNPLIAPFLRLAGAIPVHRRQDAEGEPGSNAEMFERARTALARDHAILIFPEGVSQPEPTLMPLRTGAARLLLETQSLLDRPVTVLPVGLVFEEPGTFRAGRALVIVGTPMLASALSPSERTTTVATPDVREMTARIASALRDLIVDAGDRRTLRLLDAAETAWREAPEESEADAIARVDWMRAVMRAYPDLARRQRARVDRLRRELERYVDDLERAGLTARELRPEYPPGAVSTYVARQAISFLPSFPLALVGIASHIVPYRLTALVVRIGRPSPDVEATVKLVASIVLFPLAWIVEAWLIWRWMGPLALVAFLALLVPAGLFALGWQDRVERVSRDARAFFTFLTKRDLHRSLLARRRELRDELQALARELPVEESPITRPRQRP